MLAWHSCPSRWTNGEKKNTEPVVYLPTKEESEELGKRKDMADIAADVVSFYLKRHIQHFHHFSEPLLLQPENCLDINHKSRKFLQITPSPGGPHLSLLSTLDNTCTAMGSRLLSQWASRPTRDREEVEARLDVVEGLFLDHSMRENVKLGLEELPDFGRLMGVKAAHIQTESEASQLSSALEQMFLQHNNSSGVNLWEIIQNNPSLSRFAQRVLKTTDLEENLRELQAECHGSGNIQTNKFARTIFALADVLAAIDVLAAFAEVAAERGYTRPVFVDSGELLEVTAGRHALVEEALPLGTPFIPNPTFLGRRDETKQAAANSRPSGSQNFPENIFSGTSWERDQFADVMLITGPRKSGKSCYLRQLGLIQSLAQIGSFVPAQSAVLPMVDKIVTVESLGTLQSLIEDLGMALRRATTDSLVLMDLSSVDSESPKANVLVRAVVEYLSTVLKAKAVIAIGSLQMDHFEGLENVKRWSFRGGENDEDSRPDFILRLEDESRASTDMEDLTLEGLPDWVRDRAESLLERSFGDVGEIALDEEGDLSKDIFSRSPSEVWGMACEALKSRPATQALALQKGMLIGIQKLPESVLVKVGVSKQFVGKFERPDHHYSLQEALGQIVGQAVELKFVTDNSIEDSLDV